MNIFRIIRWTIFGFSTTLATVVGIKLYFFYKKKLFINMSPPKKWKRIGTLEEITMFPIKSCAGIDIDSAKCDILGLIYDDVLDRKFALLDETGKILSARAYPKMLKIKSKIQKNQITVTAPGMNDLEIKLNTIKDNGIQETILWGSKVLVTKCGPQYDEWFSKFLFDCNEKAYLVYYNFEKPTKDVISMLQDENFLKKDTGALHDASSFMLINQQSVEDLNIRLKDDKIHHKQFRPNFYVKIDGPPYDEDKWNWVKIGNDVIFRCIAPSYRCSLTTINHITAERHKQNEPLKTLNRYRIWGRQKYPRMGVLLGLRNSGFIKKGDDIFIEGQ